MFLYELMIFAMVGFFFVFNLMVVPFPPSFFARWLFLYSDVTRVYAKDNCCVFSVEIVKLLVKHFIVYRNTKIILEFWCKIIDVFIVPLQTWHSAIVFYCFGIEVILVSYNHANTTVILYCRIKYIVQGQRHCELARDGKFVTNEEETIFLSQLDSHLYFSFFLLSFFVIVKIC